jgi:sialidase-1
MSRAAAAPPVLLLLLLLPLLLPPLLLSPPPARAPPPASPLIDVFRYREPTPGGMPVYTCYRCPALVRASGGWLLAFAEARQWAGDGCVPATATVTPDGPRALVMKASATGGASWGALQLLDAGGLNPAAVWDSVRQVALVHYAAECVGRRAMCTFEQRCRLQSGDGRRPAGAAWRCSSKRDLGAALGNYSGVSPGPGNAVQLIDPPHAGRLVFSGHFGFSVVSWWSDDSVAWQRSPTVLRAPGITDAQCSDGAACYDEPVRKNNLFCTCM